MAIMSDINSQILSSNKLKLILLATPIVVGSGICLYYYYQKNSPDHSPKSNKPKSSGKSSSDPLQKAIALKNNGNELFRQSKYDEALTLYSEAISICPVERSKELATFHQNRSACYEHLKNYENVVEDCSKAINFDKVYIKAYLRRGKAFDILEQYEEASFDFYIAATSTQFQNTDYLKLLYEVLEKFSYKKAREVMSKRKSFTFQKYLFRHLLNKFCRDPLKKKIVSITNDYDNIINNLLKDETNDEELSIDDLLLKATIELCIGKHDAGQSKLRKIIETSDDNNYKVNSLLKLTEFYIQTNKFEEAEKCLNDAEEFDSLNPDIYYIRSQLNIVNKKYDEAIVDLNKAIEIDPSFACAIGQKLFIEYQQGMMLNEYFKLNRVIKDFEQAIEKFPKSNELLLLYFQILLGKNEAKTAETFILKAIENDSQDPTLLVYRALIYIDAGELEKTKEFLDQALQLDSRCSFAYEMLADLCTKLENPKDALHYLDKAVNCSTTFEDVKNLILKQKSLELQVKAQSFFG